MDQEFKNIRAVVKWLKDHGWKVAPASVYNHAQRGIIRPNKKGVYLEKAVRQYARDYLKLPDSGMTEKRATLLHQEKGVSIALKMEAAKFQKFKREILEKKYVLRVEAEQEIIGRLALIEAQMKAKMQLVAGDVVKVLGGDDKKIEDFINFMTGQVDEVMNDCVGMEEFELFLEKTEE